MAKQVISQRWLRSVITYKEEVRIAKQTVKELEASLAEAENKVMQAMEDKDGYSIEPGKYSAVIEEVEGACRPPWKDVYLAHFEKEHETPAKVEEERIRSLYPPEKKEVLVVGEKKR